MNAKQREKMNAQIERHGRDLLAIWPNCRERDPLRLCRKLLRLERRARALSVGWCNGEVKTARVKRESVAILREMRRIIGDGKPEPIFNWDGRGCALKIQNCDMGGLELRKDPAGSGIVMPDFESEGDE